MPDNPSFFMFFTEKLHVMESTSIACMSSRLSFFLIFDKRKEKQRVGRCFLNSCFLNRLSFSAFPWTLLTQEHQCLAVQYLKNGFVAVFFTLWHSPWALVNRCSHCCFLSLFLSDMNFFVRRRFSLACRILKDKQNASLSFMRQGHQLSSLTGPSFDPNFRSIP